MLDIKMKTRRTNRQDFDDPCPWFFQRRRSILGISGTESFDVHVARLSSQAASGEAFARGVAIESYCGVPGDGPKATSDKHILTMCSKRPSRFEIRYRADDRVSYIRQPGSLTLVPP